MSLYDAALDAAKRAVLRETLKRANYNVSEAAQLAGLHRSTFYKLACELGVKLESRRRFGKWDRELPS